MPRTRSGAMPPTSTRLRLARQAVPERAVRAYEHLYQLLDDEEPDLSANVSLFLGSAAIRRAMADTASPPDSFTLARLMDVIREAEDVSDPRIADVRFYGFVEELLALAEAGRPGPEVGEGGRPGPRGGGPGDERPVPWPDLGGDWSGSEDWPEGSGAFRGSALGLP